MRDDEAARIRAAARGDAGAFEELVLRKREMVVRTAYQVLGNLEDARDVAQGVFLGLWTRLDRYDPRRKFDTWLYRVTVNAAIDHLRKRGPRGILQPLPSPDETAEGAATGADAPAWSAPAAGERRLRRRELQAAFTRLAARLAPKQRAVFVLREIEGRSTAEIADILDVRESTVRNHLLQARRALRRGLEADYPGLVPGSGSATPTETPDETPGEADDPGDRSGKGSR